VSGGKDFQWSLPTGVSQIVETELPVRFRAQVGTGNDSGHTDNESLAPFVRPINTFPLTHVTLESIIGKATTTFLSDVFPPDEFTNRSAFYVDGYLCSTANPVAEYATPFWAMIAQQSRFRRGGNVMIVNSRAVNALDQVNELGDVYAKMTVRTIDAFSDRPLYVGQLGISNGPRDYMDGSLTGRSSNLSQQPLEIYVPSYLGLNYCLNAIRDGSDWETFFGVYPAIYGEVVGPHEISLAGAPDLSFFFQIGPPRDFIYVEPPPP
jgi:hypothetical protein